MSTNRIVETDNYARDYPDESFVGPPMPEADCAAVCATFNKHCSRDRFFKVESHDYVLAPAFEP